MANNPSIYNGAINGATGGIHERWITQVQAVDYTAIRNAIVEFADVVDSLIPTDVAITAAEGDLMQAITQGVLASRYIDVSDDFTGLAQAIVALWQALRGQQQPITTDVSSDNVIIDTSTIPPADNPWPTGIGISLTSILFADGDYTTPGSGFPGFTSRIAYVNAASSRIGTLHAGVLCQAAPAAWTTEADVPPGNIFNFKQWGSGAGGGSGGASRGASGTFSIGGGGPGGGGAMNEFTMTRADVLDQLPITFTIPIGGIGGDSVVSNSISITSGNNGVSGAMNIIAGRTINETAGGGSLGTAGISNSGGSSGSGGGRMSNAISTTVGGTPNDASAVVSNVIVNILGGARSNSRNTGGSSGTSQYAIWGGAGGGSYGNGSSAIYGGRSKYGGSGGGAGGRYTSTGAAVGLACEGGNHDINATGNPNGGGVPAGVTNGEPGTNGPDGTSNEGGQGGGGGQGAVGATAATATAGRGGDGGFPGGGAGGGGAAFSSGGSGEVATSGEGGDGGDALTLITITL